MNNTKNTTKKEVSLFTRLGRGLIKVIKNTAKFILIALNKVIKAIDYLVVFIVKKIIYLFSLVIHSSMAIWLKHNVGQLLKFLKLKLLKLYNAPYTKRLRKTALAQFVRKIVVVLTLRVKRAWKAFWRALGFRVVSLKRSLIKRPQLRPVFISLVLVAMVVSLFLPIVQVRATTLQWSKNSDFSNNQIGKCQTTTVSNINISGSAYNDPTCQAAGADASMSLPASGAYLSDVKQVAAGAYHTLALKNDGTVWGWGNNMYGQLGDNTVVNKQLPVQVKDSSGNSFISGVTQITSGAFHSMALKSDGTVWSWGLNSQIWVIGGWSGNGQLGDGTGAQRNIPIQVKNTTGSGYLSGITNISAGAYHSMAVKSDGTLWAWGSNYWGQMGTGVGSAGQQLLPVQVKNNDGIGFLTNVKSIAASNSVYSYTSNVALKNDGTVWAWGANESGQVGDNTTALRVWLPVQVKNNDGIGFLNNVNSVVAGASHSLALKNDGTVWAWGKNANGQIGDGTTSDRYLPTQIKDSTGTNYLSSISQISASGIHSLALNNNGAMLAWGLNSNGQLGQNTTTQLSLPAYVKDNIGSNNLSDITSITAGIAQSFAVNSNGLTYGWGVNSGASYTSTNSLVLYTGDGQTGYSEGIQNSNKLLPSKILANFTANSLTDVKDIAAGEGHTLVLKNDGTVWAWGLNSNGQLGDGTTANKTSLAQVKDSTGTGFLTDIISIAAGSTESKQSFALKNDGTVWAWGLNSNGQLGDGTTTQRPLPTKVKDPTGTGNLSEIIKISTGKLHTIALKNDGTVWAWGHNNYGQLGDGTVTQRLLPIQTKDPTGSGYLTGVSQVTATGTGTLGYSHTIALKNDGSVWAWGANGNGQLGQGFVDSIAHNLPLPVINSTNNGYLNDISAISSGAFYSLALKNDGTVWGWGYNANGQLGDGTLIQKNLPTQVKDSTGSGYLNGVKDIKGSSYYTVALMSNGEAWGWGWNSSGQLGDGTLGTSRPLPIKIKNTDGTSFISDIQKIVGGGTLISPYGAFVLALKSNGTVQAWGQNAYGQLGDNSTIDKALPSQVLSSVYYTGGHVLSGSASGYVVDMGPTRKTRWQSVLWNTDVLPATNNVTFNARTSNDGTNWSGWSSGFVQNVPGSTSGTGDLSSLPFSRYIELKATLATGGDLSGTPVLNDFSLVLQDDTTPPPTNASDITMKKSNSGASINAGEWSNAPTPYFAWTAGVDDGGGAGIDGYCLYLGQDANADVTTSKGLLGTSQFDTDGKCQYATHSESLDLSVAGVLGSQLSSSDQPYYLLAKAIDKAGNLYDGTPASFNFKYDNTPPNNVGFVSLPSQFIPTKDVTITWPTTGGQAVSDVNSGIAGLQYKIGNDGTWYGANHNGAQDLSDVLPNNGSYQTNATYDYPLINEGNNLIYFRTLDNAGNVSTTQTSAVLKINTSSPSQPQSLNANPSTNTTNSFAFSWAEPQTFVGSKDNLTYCYTVNTLPTISTCTYTNPGQTSIATGAYATQPGDNTFYVVARDESGNINYATAANVTFSANTSAPGIPLNADVADISVKATQNWKLALSWEKPSNEGAGIASYRIYRSTSQDSGFSQVATTSGTSYVDGSLSQSMYYYKVVACDSANNCGAESSIVSKTPTGRFTSPPELITAPSVSAGTRKASITWTTDRTSDSRVAAGTKSGKYGEFETASSNQTKSHTVELTGLEPGTTYYYKAKWTDEDGNTGTSSELSFTTLPAPKIKNVEVIKTTLSSATIKFTSVDATKVNVLYGQTESFGGIKELNTAASESTYTVELDGLEDGVSYYYKILTTDVESSVYDSNRVDSFTTPPRPRISNLRFQPVEGEPTSTQKVSWTTNVATNSTVTYGISGTSGSDLQDSKLTLDHSITIKDLQDDSEYFLLAQSRDGNGNLAVSDRQIFRTALDTRPPRISDISVEPSIRGTGAEARGQVVVSWKTDEPATSQVAYAEGTDVKEFNNRTSEDTTLTTEHVVIVSDLPTSKVYSVQPLSKDKAQNQVSGDSMPAIIGRASDSVLTIVLNTMRKVLGL